MPSYAGLEAQGWLGPAEAAKLRADSEELVALRAERVRWRTDNDKLEADNDRLRAAARAILKQARVIDTDAAHLKVPRELVGRLRAAHEQKVDET